jgi:protein required for attachment to host cells
MSKLKNALVGEYKDRISILTPKNCQQVRFKLVSKKSAKIIGKLAKTVMQETDQIKHVLMGQSPNMIQALPASMPSLP